MSRTALSIVSFLTAATVSLGCGGGTATPGGTTTTGMAGMSGPGRGAGTSGTAGSAGGTMPPGPMGRRRQDDEAGDDGNRRHRHHHRRADARHARHHLPGRRPQRHGAAGARLHTRQRARVPDDVRRLCDQRDQRARPARPVVRSAFTDRSPPPRPPRPSTPAATIEYLHETAGGQEYYRFRIIFDPAFVDNTYGVNAIGWVTKGHTFKDLVGSDHAELSLFDGTPALVSMFDIDYITANASSACLYGALGVSGGEGKMLVGDAKYVLASTTSLDRNLNGCGYCKSSACGGDCTVDSPVTDANYTPNPAAPNWDYRVVYEVWVDAAAFAGKGFGGASITFVHASPSKASSNTVTVTPKPCGGCPEGTAKVETPLGSKCCPPGTSEGPTCGCPAGTSPVETRLGTACCPEGTTRSRAAKARRACPAAPRAPS